MSDFTNAKLVASCVAFVEMLSRDSTPFRIDSLAANRIYEYLLNKDSNGTTIVDQVDIEYKGKILKKKIGLSL